MNSRAQNTVVESIFLSVLRDVGGCESRCLHDDECSEFWQTTIHTPMGAIEGHFAFIKKTFTFEKLEKSARGIKRRAPNLEFCCVVQSSDEMLKGRRAKIADILGVSNVVSLPSFLFQALISRVQLQEPNIGVEYFVEPNVRMPNREDATPSVKTLYEWMRSEGSPDSEPLAVLLAPAGTGKTSVASELFSAMARDKDTPRIPLLIKREAWAALLHTSSVELADVWRCAMGHCYPGAIIGYEQVERFLSFGAIAPIFDGLDELCTAFPLDINPEDTVRSLYDLLNWGGGRMLLTSRTSFWFENIGQELQSRVLQIELCPFEDSHIDKYMIARFAADRASSDRAKKILSRVGSAIQPWRHSKADQIGNLALEPRLDRVPFVIMLAAESAVSSKVDYAEKYGALLESSDPLRAVVLAICDREKIRQKIGASAEKQFHALQVLATEFEEPFSVADLEICCDEAGIDQEDVKKFCTHWFLFFDGSGYNFHYAFVREYLTASVVVDWLECGGSDRPIEKILTLFSLQHGSLLDAGAALVANRLTGEWIRCVRAVFDAWRFDEVALAGFVHLTISIAKYTSQATRRDVTRALLIAIGDLENIRFDRVSFVGSVSRLDLRGVTFVNCMFRNIEWTHCEFDANTIFRRCHFRGTFIDDHSLDLSLVKIEESAFISRAAQIAFAGFSSLEKPIFVDSDCVSEVFFDILRWFIRGEGYKTKKERDVRAAALRSGALGEYALERLKKDGVLGEFLASFGRGMKVEDGGAVRKFFENRLLTGCLRNAHASVLDKFGGRTRYH